MLKGKNILIGVTGSIAAYKAAMLIRLLVKEGAEVRVIMTKLAKEFITPLTLATLAKNPILVDFFNPENGEWNSHVSLGEWADAYLIAPITANTMGKMCSGVADNLLVTTYLSARCPVFIAPAMDLDMYQHITTKQNISTLQSHGVKVIEPTSGELASGLVGKGRMAEPEEIVSYLNNYFGASLELKGKRAMITVGGTLERIDAVRYIGNHSTGKMGYAVAAELKKRGAEVTIIRGSVSDNLIGSIGGVTEIEALSANDMYREATLLAEQSDIIVMSAAVADYTIENPSSEKIKKSDALSLNLTPTRDIAAEIGASRRGNQLLVGFALESANGVEYAKEKLTRKRLDFIVLNSLTDKGAGFGYDTNKVSIIDSDSVAEYSLKDKKAVAKDIVDEIVKRFSSL